MTTMKYSWIASAALVGLAVTGCQTMNKPKGETYAATLAAPSGITSAGKGTGTFSYAADTHTLTYTVKYEGLTGPAVAAHIHGPAEPGANAGVVVPFANAASPITGTATLTDAQAAELKAGKYYVNIHTAANKGGEIRGQITAKK
jgi:Cu/Zn superoxide dismutase